MALNPLSEYVSGVKSLAFKLFGKKSDNSWEAIKTNDAGAMLTTLTGSSLPLVASTAEIGKVRLVGETLEEQLTEIDAVAGVLTFSENIETIEIYNTDTVNDGVFTVNGIAITVPKSASVPSVYKSLVGGTPSAEVTVTGATTYIVSRYA